MSAHKLTLKYLSKNLAVVLGIVMIWRGMWYILEWVDFALFHGNHAWMAIGGIVLGVALLYIPDHNLDELSKL